MVAAWNAEAVKDPTTLLVLLALADEADNDGAVVEYRQSQAELARKTRLSIRTVRKALERLIALGLVEVAVEARGHAPAGYQLALDASRPAAGAALDASRPAAGAALDRQQVPPSAVQTGSRCRPRPAAGAALEAGDSTCLPTEPVKTPAALTDGGLFDPGPYIDPAKAAAKEAAARVQQVYEMTDAVIAARAHTLVGREEVRAVLRALLSRGMADDDAVGVLTEAQAVSLRSCEVVLAQRQARTKPRATPGRPNLDDPDRVWD